MLERTIKVLVPTKMMKGRAKSRKPLFCGHALESTTFPLHRQHICRRALSFHACAVKAALPSLGEGIKCVKGRKAAQNPGMEIHP
jgi:hypothetical protein